MTRLLIVGLGGFVGAVARYGVSGLVHRSIRTTFPLGTLVVNTVGCLVIGALLYAIEDRALLSPNMRLFGAIGLLGAFTTFSTFGYETLELLGEGRWAATALSITANVVLGLAAVWLGRTALRAVGI